MQTGGGLFIEPIAIGGTGERISIKAAPSAGPDDLYLETGTPLTADGQAAYAGYVHVQDDGIKGGRRGKLQGRLPGLRAAYLISLPREVCPVCI